MLRRAVFSDYQRKGLEKRFQVQKYISKPDRKKLAEKLGLKDSQVREKERKKETNSLGPRGWHAASSKESRLYQRERKSKGRYGIATRKMSSPAEPHHLQTLIREAEKMGIVFVGVGCR